MAWKRGRVASDFFESHKFNLHSRCETRRAFSDKLDE